MAASSTLTILRKAGRLLKYQYEIKNSEEQVGRRLEDNLQEALDDILSEGIPWRHMTKYLELAFDADTSAVPYGFVNSFKIPNDCKTIIKLYSNYYAKGQNSYISNYEASPSGLRYGYNNSDYFLCNPEYRRVGDRIYSNLDIALLEYVSNDISELSNINENWFLDLVAYRLAYLVGNVSLGDVEYRRLKDDYNITLIRAKNKNSLLDKQVNFGFGVYPFKSSK